ncbi:MAG: hypothetical protein AB2A00_11675 [Myxococcota bacterium]
MHEALLCHALLWPTTVLGTLVLAHNLGSPWFPTIPWWASPWSNVGILWAFLVIVAHLASCGWHGSVRIEWVRGGSQGWVVAAAFLVASVAIALAMVPALDEFALAWEDVKCC